MDDFKDKRLDQQNTRVETIEKVNDPNGDQLNKVVVLSIKLILIGLSAVYLLYETIELIKIYNNYETFVTIHYENRDLKEIPSFTICLPTIIDKNLILDKYPDLKEKLRESQSDEKRLNILREYLDKSLESMAWTQLTVQEVDVFNCTLNYWSIKSDTYSMDSVKQRSGLDCREVVKPIESYSNAKTKCFTYFSRLSADKSFIGKSELIFSFIS